MSQVLVIDDSPTIRTIVSRALNQAGYRVHEAKDGAEGIELANQHRPDLVLVDFVMPRMNGFQFCKHLQQDTELAATPCVLISAKADTLAKTFMEQTGAKAVLPKPFTPQALLDTAKKLLKPEHTIAQSNQTTNSAPIHIPSTQSTQTPYLEALIDGLHPMWSALNIRPEDFAHAWHQHMSDAHTRALKLHLQKALRDPHTMSSLAGRIEHAPLIETLQMLQLQGQTGTLHIEDQDHAIYICIRNGCVDIATGDGSSPEYRLGRYLIERGIVDRNNLESLLQRDPQDLERLLGTRLLQNNQISAEQLQEILAEQTTDVMCEALRWEKGIFRFERAPFRREIESAKLEIPMQSILLEAIRRMDEWNLVRSQIQDQQAKYSRTSLNPSQLAKLEASELQVLKAIDGMRSIDSIIEHTSMDRLKVCKTMVDLINKGMVVNHSLQ